MSHLLVGGVSLRGKKKTAAITDIILLEVMMVMNMRQVCNIQRARAELLACCPFHCLSAVVKLSNSLSFTHTTEKKDDIEKGCFDFTVFTY